MICKNMIEYRIIYSKSNSIFMHSNNTYPKFLNKSTYFRML
jgi:hypothetical protein